KPPFATVLNAVTVCAGWAVPLIFTTMLSPSNTTSTTSPAAGTMPVANTVVVVPAERDDRVYSATVLEERRATIRHEASFVARNARPEIMVAAAPDTALSVALNVPFGLSTGTKDAPIPAPLVTFT